MRSSHLVPGPGHAAAGVPAQAGALQVGVCILIIANPEVLTIAEDNIRLDNAALYRMKERIYSSDF